jgi:uncharacterized protein involved in cysteine biosynthesis
MPPIEYMILEKKFIDFIIPFSIFVFILFLFPHLLSVISDLVFLISLGIELRRQYSVFHLCIFVVDNK